jgi:16S rRNA (cytosine1402-N4)-methyltransferase
VSAPVQTHDPRHAPVLLAEVIAGLAPAAGEIHVDGTFGAGGYTRAILHAGVDRVIAFDRDPDAIGEGAALVAASEGRLTLVADRFSRMAEVLAERDVPTVDGVTLDIGVSSMQLDRADRGFSFQADGPLDMRMEQAGESAADFLNTADEAEIASDRPCDRCRAADCPHDRTGGDRAARDGPQAARQEGSRDPHLSGDPHPPEP